MARLRKIAVSAINVAMHEHSTESYVALFQALDDANVSAKYHGDKYATFGALRPLRKDNLALGIYGLIYRFTQIETDGRWFNKRAKKQAEPEDLLTLNIPPALGANLEVSRFLFLPQGHTFYFESRTDDGKTFSPGSMATAIARMCAQPKILKQFGKVETTPLPQAGTLQRVLGLPKIGTLTLLVKRPNPDQTDEEKILRRLQRQKVDRIAQVMSAAPRESITPDAETKMLASVAANNGYVTARGKDHRGHVVVESTKDHPWVVDESFEPKTAQAGDVFVRVATSMDESRRRR